MKTKTIHLFTRLFIVIFIIANYTSFAQNVGISATGSVPDNSAMLDVTATNKGLLLPRVTLTGTTDATTIASPATSLLVYNTTAAGAGATAVSIGFYYNSGTPGAPVWAPMASVSKFTVPFGTIRNIQINTTPSPLCGPSNLGTATTTNYSNPASSVPNNVKYPTEAIFTAQSNCTFNGLNGWISEPFASDVVTISLYRFRQISGSSPPMGTLVGTTTVNCASTSKLYSFSIAAPGTPFTAQQGDLFLLFFSVATSATNFNVNGSMEFINN